MKFIVFITLLASFSISAQAESTPSGIVYEKDNSFMLSAPDGWVLDKKSGLYNGIPIVAYPKGSTWAKSEIVMYPKAFLKPGDSSLKKFIEEDIAKLVKINPKLTYKEIEKLETADKKKAIVYEIIIGKKDDCENIAYFEEEKGFITLAMFSKSKELLKKNQKAFKQFVKSYKFYTYKK